MELRKTPLHNSLVICSFLADTMIVLMWTGHRWWWVGILFLLGIGLGQVVLHFFFLHLLWKTFWKTDTVKDRSLSLFFFAI